MKDTYVRKTYEIMFRNKVDIHKISVTQLPAAEICCKSFVKINASSNFRKQKQLTFQRTHPVL